MEDAFPEVGTLEVRADDVPFAVGLDAFTKFTAIADDSRRGLASVCAPMSTT